MEKQRLNIAKEPIAEGQSYTTRTPKTDKRYNKSPCFIMQEAFKYYTENGGNERQAIIAAGYSKQTAVKPQNVTSTKSWKELKDKYISKNKLTATHSKLLTSKNENIQAKMVDLGYKVHGLYSDNEAKTTVINVQVNNLYKNALSE